MSKKKYIYEFLVLFLAVFLGFLSETYREKRQDRNDGKDFIKRLYRDIKEDSLELNGLIAAMESQQAEVFKLLALRNLDFSDPENQKKLYSQVCRVEIWQDRDYLPNTITLSQIKSTGAWRLMDSEVADQITVYDQSIEVFKKSMQRVNSRNIDLLFYYQEILNWHVLLFDASTSQNYMLPSYDANAPLPTFDATPREMRTFFNNLATFYYTLGGHINNTKIHRKMGYDLQLYLQKRYRFGL